jgi:hypothetical protein
VSKSGNGKHLKESEEREFREKVLTVLSELDLRSTLLLNSIHLIMDRIDAMNKMIIKIAMD